MKKSVLFTIVAFLFVVLSGFLTISKSKRAINKKYRVVHFTSISSMKKIKEDNIIKAFDQNKVFTVKHKSKETKGSARDIEARLGIGKGRANAYVIFDVTPSEVEIVENEKTGATEHILEGDVSLKGRNPIFGKK